MNQFVSTDNSSDVLQESGWEITPGYFLDIAVAPPSNQEYLTPISEEFMVLGLFTLTPENEPPTIDDEAFNRLIKEGLDEYVDIWEALAQR